MIEKPFAQVAFPDFISLVEAGRPEDRRLDYKRDLPGGTDDDKREFLADLSSFANAAGGDMLIGIEEADGIPVQIPGLDATEADGAILRLESLALNGLRPRVTGIRTTFIPNPADHTRGVIIMRIPPSRQSPHQVTFKGRNRFYTRHSRGKAEMDVNELRDAFVDSSERLVRLRSFHGFLPRLSPVPLAGPSLLVSTIPLSLLSERRTLELREFEDGILPLWGSGWDFRQVLEGLLVYSSSGVGSRAQTLVYRSGWAECWTNQGSVSQPDATTVWPARIEGDLDKSVSRSIAKLQKHGIEGPWMVQATLKDVKGHDLFLDRHWHNPTDRSEFAFGEVVFDELSETTLLPIKRELWWGFGHDRPDAWKADGGN